jgi:hypothetical protein
MESCLPEVLLVHGTIVNVGGDGLLIRTNLGIETMSLLLLSDEVLGGSNDTGALDASDGLIHHVTHEIGINGKTCID